jgi:glutaredoxin-dependent peroxiredoxin
MSLKVGDKAPDFKLPTVDRSDVSLSQFQGKKVVIFFFPMAWTGVCTKEMCQVQEHYKIYEGLGAVVLGISVDSFFAQKHFQDEFKLNNITFLSDFNKDVIRKYDVVNPEFIVGYKEVAKRSTFVIDREGIIRFIEILPTPGDLPNMDAVQEAVKSIK